MRKILVLLVFIVVDAGSVEELYGSWVPVAFYPVTPYIPMCIRVSFAKDVNNVQCSCADGKNTTTLEAEFSLPEQRAERLVFPVLVVEGAADVAPALNVSCRCGDTEYRSRKVAVVINNDYVVLYESHNYALFTEIAPAAPNNAQLFAREIPSAVELLNVMNSIKDLVPGNNGIMCTQGFHEAEVRYKALRRRHGRLRKPISSWLGPLPI